MRLWTQTKDGWQQLAEYKGRDIVFSPDGKLIALIVDDAVQLRRVEGLDDLLARGCNWLQDYLTTHDKEKTKSCVPVFEAEINSIEGEAAKADAIAARVKKVISEKMEEDPMLYLRLSELIEEAIRDRQINNVPLPSP
jgi:CRISPR/Cas system-associated endoribonuclease Cas2